MVQKDDLPKAMSNKNKVGQDSRGRARQPSEKKHEVVQAYAVTKTTIETTAQRQYAEGIPKCN